MIISQSLKPSFLRREEKSESLLELREELDDKKQRFDKLRQEVSTLPVKNVIG